MLTQKRILGVNGQAISVSNQAQSGKAVTASSGAPFASNAASMSVNGFYQSNYQFFWSGLLPAEPNQIDTSTLALFYRDIYLNDQIGGSVVDIVSTFPFSGWNLTGLPPDKLELFNSALEQLQLQTAMPLISTAQLVDGFFAGSVVFDDKKKQFIDIMIHDALSCAVIPAPFLTVQPTINVRVGQATQQFLHDTSEYAARYIDSLPKAFVDMLRGGAFGLDPLTTLFVPRRSTTDRAYTSYLHRLLPMYMLEKTLYRGTMVQTQRKQRAMTHIQCLAGDTLVSTCDGLRRIDSFVDHDTESEPFSVTLPKGFTVTGFDGLQHKATHWHYRGKKETVVVTTESGRKITLTPDHKVPALTSDGYNEAGIEAKDLLNAYMVVRDKTSLDYSVEKTLQIKGYDYLPNYNSIRVNPPTSMTPELAFLLGCLTGDGTVRDDGLITFSSVNDQYLKAFVSAYAFVFGVRLKTKVSYTNCIRGNKPVLIVTHNNKGIVHYLKQLVLFVVTKGYTKKYNSSNRDIPTSILQANTVARYGFLAGYIQADGTVRRGKDRSCSIRIFSISKKLFHNLQVMLTDLGVSSVQRNNYIDIRPSSAHPLLNNMRMWMAMKCPNRDLQDVKRLNHGIPVNGWLNQVLSRIKKEYRSNGTHRNVLVTDTGGFIYPHGNVAHILEAYTSGRRPVLRYGASRSTRKVMDLIQSMCGKLYNDVAYLLSQQYQFDKVVSITAGKIIPVYDLSMTKQSKHLFSANGLLVHNCGDSDWTPTPQELNAIVESFQTAEYDPMGGWIGTRNAVQAVDLRSGGDFWKWTDLADALVPYKMRALGQSESFLSQEGNYSATEQGYAVFLESTHAYRTDLTARIFTNRLFPLIAVAYGLYKNPDGPKAKPRHIVDFLNSHAGRANLMIPELHWHKELEAKGEENMGELLEQASNKGIPIPLKMWMAAAHIDPETLLRDLAEDVTLRENLAKYTKKDTSHDAEDPEAMDGGDESDDGSFNPREASVIRNPFARPTTQVVSHTINPLKKPLLSREFGDSARYALTKTGKVAWVPDAVHKRRQTEADNNIRKVALRAQKDRNYRSELVKRNRGHKLPDF